MKLKKLFSAVVAITLISSAFCSCKSQPKISSKEPEQLQIKKTALENVDTTPKLVDNYENYCAVINGIEVSFPLSYDEFKSMGLELSKPSDGTDDLSEDYWVQPYERIDSCYEQQDITKGIYSIGDMGHIGLFLENNTNEVLPEKECTVIGFYTQERSDSNDVIIKNMRTGAEIEYGKTTKKELFDLDKDFFKQGSVNFISDMAFISDKYYPTEDVEKDNLEFLKRHIFLLFDDNSCAINYICMINSESDLAKWKDW